MSEKITTQLTTYNQTYKEIDEIYRNYAKVYGLSEATFWVLYSLWESGDVCSQRELCSNWSYPPQTINSALKVLEKKGFIELAFVPGNRKNKQILFTSTGRALAERVLKPLLQAECNAFSGLTDQERAMLLSATQKYIALLKKETEIILNLSLLSDSEQ